MGIITSSDLLVRVNAFCGQLRRTRRAGLGSEVQKVSRTLKFQAHYRRAFTVKSEALGTLLSLRSGLAMMAKANVVRGTLTYYISSYAPSALRAQKATRKAFSFLTIL